MAPLNFNARQFTKRGLRMQDYVVQTNVTALPYSVLMGQITNNTQLTMTAQTQTQTPPVLVLIDTEGWDCSIILGMAQNSPYLAQFLIFEHHQCKPAIRQETERYLRQTLGYTDIVQLDGQNTLAVRKNGAAFADAVTARAEPI